jgi:hypothetical protein
MTKKTVFSIVFCLSLFSINTFGQDTLTADQKIAAAKAKIDAANKELIEANREKIRELEQQNKLLGESADSEQTVITPVVPPKETKQPLTGGTVPSDAKTPNDLTPSLVKAVDEEKLPEGKCARVNLDIDAANNYN